ncbi:2-succinylbenzoate--coa ligase [Plakobranchus ocellatus]|uniref:2-succinylbenzoate--coa ligase n=1 Tax=Plakobranchus ocellatus TaxID=259542 RepID=A0AAV4DPX8_9GAST|nr:2-succinylbenzoate--coa ligase [Plakobranchus ocellatus]
MGRSLVSEIVQRGKEFPKKPAFVFLGDNSRRTVLTFGDVSYLSQKFGFKYGSFWLGDRGYINSKGQITVFGRGAHAIMRGDDVVYPDQLESPILQCPGLAEVLITGVPDLNKFEEICALLVRQSGAGEELDEADVRRFCQESLFINPDNPKFNPIPKYFFFVPQIPKLNNGKFDRIAAKRLAAELISRRRP